MSKKVLRLNPNANQNAAGYRATVRLPVTPAPLLTIERAIADNLCPTALRQVADRNLKAARKDGESGARLLRQADNLLKIADKLDLLGFGVRRAA